MKTEAWKLGRIRARRERRAKGRILKRRKLSEQWKVRYSRLRQFAPLVQNPFTQNRSRTIHEIVPHPSLDLEDNYEATMDTLLKIREASRLAPGKLMVDFKVIQEISAAAALLLVAECDRWRKLSIHKFLRVVDYLDWVPSVRRRLTEMGFFHILKARGDLPNDPPVEGQDRYLPFASGRCDPGQPAKDLRVGIERRGRTLTDSSALYDALVEAMENANEHAYKGLPDSKLNNWWISASVNAENNRMTVMVVDHGLGLVKTLPRSSLWDEMKSRLMTLSNDEEHLIRAAFDPSFKNKSRTGLDNRGKGLRDNIRGYVDIHPSEGSLLAIANGARYRYSKTKIDSNTKESVRTAKLKTPFPGTFIQWEIEDYGSPIHEDN